MYLEEERMIRDEKECDNYQDWARKGNREDEAFMLGIQEQNKCRVRHGRMWLTLYFRDFPAVFPNFRPANGGASVAVDLGRTSAGQKKKSRFH